MQEQGDVSVVTSPSANLINNRVGEIEVVEKTQYTQSVKVTPNQDSDPTTETVLEIAYNEGYTLFALPKITDDGEVFLHVSSELSSLVKMDSQEINEITQKTQRSVIVGLHKLCVYAQAKHGLSMVISSR